MLSLAEELMLLAMHDEKGKVLFNTSMTLNYGLAGAILLELKINGWISIENKKIKLLQNVRCGDKLFDFPLELISTSNKERNAKYWIEKIASKFKYMQDLLIDKLLDKGILKRVEKDFLWVFTSETYPTRDPRPEHEIRQRIKQAVLSTYCEDERTVAIISLMKCCDLINEVFEGEFRREAKKNIKEIMSNNEIAKAIDEIILSLMVISTTVITASTAATIST